MSAFDLKWFRKKYIETKTRTEEHVRLENMIWDLARAMDTEVSSLVNKPVETTNEHPKLAVRLDRILKEIDAGQWGNPQDGNIRYLRNLVQDCRWEIV